jgi:hypothetical protein
LTIPECFCFDPDQNTIRDFAAAALVAVGYFGLRFTVSVAVHALQLPEWFPHHHL